MAAARIPSHRGVRRLASVFLGLSVCWVASARSEPSGADEPRSLQVLRSEALAYEHGEGVVKDPMRAAKLYCDAARLGDAEAQFSLGWMYANGRGVARDDGLAGYFFGLAARQGHASAEKMLRFADPALSWRLAAGSTLVGSDTLNGSLTRAAGENVGSYAIDQGSLGNGNYAITFNGSSLTISPKAITVNADARSKAYGSADPALTWQLAAGSTLVGSDTLNGSLTRATGENVGSYAIDQGSLGNGNYTITFNGSSLTISPKAITVNADAQSKAYGGADPALTWHLAAGSTLVGSDVLSGSLTRASGESAGSYAIEQGSLGNDNYAITFNGNTLTIGLRATGTPPGSQLWATLAKHDAGQPGHPGTPPGIAATAGSGAYGRLSLRPDFIPIPSAED